MIPALSVLKRHPVPTWAWRFFLFLLVLLLIMTVCAGQARSQSAPERTFQEIDRQFAFGSLTFRQPPAVILEQHADWLVTPQPGSPGVFSVRPAPDQPPAWGQAELTDLRWVFQENRLYAVEMDFSGKRNVLAVLDQAVTRFGPRESLRGRFSLNARGAERAPQELIKEWKGDRVLIIMSYWDNLSHGSLRILDRETYENALQPRRSERQEARNRLSGSVMEMDWGIPETMIYRGEAELPAAEPAPEAEPEPETPAAEPSTRGQDRSRLEDSTRNSRWPAAPSDGLFD